MSVYTTLSRSELQQLSDRFALGTLAGFAPIAEGIENSNYRVDSDLGCYVLTLYERGDARRVGHVLRAVARLADAGVPCPRPVPLAGTKADFLTLCRQKPVSVSPFAEGDVATAPDERQLEALGRALADLHRAGAPIDLDPAAAHELEVLVPKAKHIAEQVREQRPGLAGLLRSEAAIQQRCEPTGLPRGLIHADLFRDNVLFRNGSAEVVALLDFHLAGQGPWMYDLAVVMLDACWQGEAVGGDRARALLRGYRSRRAVSGEEFRAVPILLRRAALRFLCLRLERFGPGAPRAEVGVWKDPAELEHKLLALGGGGPVRL